MGNVRQDWKIAAITGVILSCIGCTAVNDGSTTIKPSPLSTFSADENAELGSRSNPINLGDIAVINDWQVQIVSVNKNALKFVMDSDAYASPPASNERFVLFNIKATYIGDDSGNTFSKSCSYSVNTFDENEETFTGATVSGNLCYIVEGSQIAGATVSIQANYSSQDRQFVSID
jgi:hypothetical protein